MLLPSMPLAIVKVVSTAGLQIQEALQQPCTGEPWTVLQLCNFFHTQRWFVGRSQPTVLTVLCNDSCDCWLSSSIDKQWFD